MFELAKASFLLALRGKLFRNPGYVVRQGLLSFALTLLAMVVLAKLGLPLLYAVVIGAFAGGYITPFLLKDIRAA
jgi:hypothetical protein